jgi:DNA (cytosine-5)-methyltransferase 1
MTTFATLFSGGEGVGVGLTAAGLHHTWGVEYDAAIAGVAAMNGFDLIVDDVRSVDYAALPRVDWLHASPVCTRASVANSGATESEDDISMAAAVVRALKAQEPNIFTLENVWQYRTFRSFTDITDALGAMGYFWTYDHVNAADYGVPQTRRRLLLRASRGLLPHLPQPVPWVGWYAAIEDLIPTLPESKLAPWQLARLPDELRGTVLLDGNNGSTDTGAPIMCDELQPAFTLGSARSAQHRALLPARVVSMTSRCLARFQSFPDTYQLPDKRTLAARVIGNAVPPLLMQRIAEGFLQ